MVWGFNIHMSQLSADLIHLLINQMLTYNPQAVAFGYFYAQLHWMDQGEISMKFQFQVGQRAAFHAILIYVHKMHVTKIPFLGPPSH